MKALVVFSTYADTWFCEVPLAGPDELNRLLRFNGEYAYSSTTPLEMTKEIMVFFYRDADTAGAFLYPKLGGPIMNPGEYQYVIRTGVDLDG